MIEAIAQEIGIGHSAVSQTVTQMVKNELVMLKPGAAASAQDETAPRVIPKT